MGFEVYQESEQRFLVLKDGQEIARAKTWMRAQELLEKAGGKAEGKLRVCLACNQSFLSWGAGNRMCPTCRKKS